MRGFAEAIAKQGSVGSARCKSGVSLSLTARATTAPARRRVALTGLWPLQVRGGAQEIEANHAAPSYKLYQLLNPRQTLITGFILTPKQILSVAARKKPACGPAGGSRQTQAVTHRRTDSPQLQLRWGRSACCNPPKTTLLYESRLAWSVEP